MVIQPLSRGTLLHRYGCAVLPAAGATEGKKITGPGCKRHPAPGQAWLPCKKPKTSIFKFNEEVFHEKLNNAIRNSFDSTIRKARETLSNQRGDFYISDAVKIIIAVVLGALLLAALTAIFNSTVIPRITQEITRLFG